MRRFITLTLAVLVGAATASLRLGEYCDTNASCNSGLCYQGVCRAALENSTMPALATKMMRVASQQKSQIKGALVNKIISFSKQAEAGNMHQRFKSYLSNDMEQSSLDTQFRAKLADNLRSFAASRSETPAATTDINAQLRMSLMNMMNRMSSEGVADNQTTPAGNNSSTPAGDNSTTPAGQNQTVPEVPTTEAPASSAWLWILIIVGLIAAGAGGFYVYKRKQAATQNSDGYNKVSA